MLIKSNPNVLVTLNIGLTSSLNWGGYKAHTAKHGEVLTLVDVLDVPHRIARIVERVKQITYSPNNYHKAGYPLQPYGIDYGHEDDRQVKFKLVESGTEPTLVVQFEAVGREIIGQVFALAEELKQDAIAVWIHNDVNGGIGQLIGRYNYVWGEFNEEYFVHI
ncbi:TPA: hypothetical protein NNR24_004459 [Salmonella enterica]|nr:hypothetical protein [Salmonella enterica]HCH8522538.1 hypothetical protein [Salmonella enterica]HCH8758448.1 hypothetical protein [Salmonella enterica]HCH8762991.1 hypothetical protein [Salmonella enterica]HCH9029288.1 hypothetical protein [Salmonella enterica]